MKNKCVSKFFISSVFTSNNQCPIYPNSRLHTWCPGAFLVGITRRIAKLLDTQKFFDTGKFGKLSVSNTFLNVSKHL